MKFASVSGLGFHPNAAAQFDTNAADLLPRLHPAKGETRPTSGFSPDHHVSATISQSDIIGAIRTSSSDARGVKSIGFQTEDGHYEFTGKGYADLHRLVSGVHRLRNFAESVTYDTTMSATLDWVREVKFEGCETPFTEYLVEKLTTKIASMEMVVPIASLSVEVSVPVGRVVIQPVSRSEFEATYAKWIAKQESEDTRGAARDHVEKQRKKFQGYAAAHIHLTAEFSRAVEVALQEAEAATGLLRFFSPASVSPRVTSCCVPYGQQFNPGHHVFALRGGVFEREEVATSRKSLLSWKLPSSEIAFVRRVGLDALSQLYREPRTPFHGRLLDGLAMFTRVSLASDLSDKLVLLLASLESMLLRNDAEPIQQNLADRLALIVGDALEARREIVATTRRIYRIRSRFLHHAQEIADIEEVERFMVYAWRAFFHLISSRDRFRTLDDFLVQIDNMKYS